MILEKTLVSLSRGQKVSAGFSLLPRTGVPGQSSCYGHATDQHTQTITLLSLTQPSTHTHTHTCKTITLYNTHRHTNAHTDTHRHTHTHIHPADIEIYTVYYSSINT